MTRGYARREFVDLHLGNFRYGAFLVDHIEKVRAQFSEVGCLR